MNEGDLYSIFNSGNDVWLYTIEICVELATKELALSKGTENLNCYIVDNPQTPFVSVVDFKFSSVLAN
jgi:hypothetical protein